MPKTKQILIEGVDYYIEDGKWIFMEKYHLQRGYCCKSIAGCRHCPYGHLGKIKKTP